MAKGFLDGYQTYDTSKGYGNPKAWKESFSKRMSMEEAHQILTAEQKGPFQMLELQKDATQADIKKAFRRLLMQWHPDKNQDRIEEANRQTKLIIAAYRCLQKK